MLLIILGAGASYDSAPSYPPISGSESEVKRPPLSDDLFALRYAHHIDEFGGLKAVAAQLRHRAEGASVEAVLEAFQEQSGSYLARQHQLMAVRYYLRKLLRETDQPWYGHVHGTTNLHTMFDEIRRFSRTDEPILIVTFNYDRLIEWALRDMSEWPAQEGLYLKHTVGRFKVFKMHGSVDWGRRVDVVTPIAPYKAAFPAWIIENAPSVRVSDHFFYANEEHPRLGAPQVAPTGIPAIAIPLQRKQHFELPTDHLSTLKEFLPRVTMILSIGWRASDVPFMELLREHLKGNVQGTAVAHKDAERIALSFTQAGLHASLTAQNGGFTQFIMNGGLGHFLGWFAAQQ